MVKDLASGIHECVNDIAGKRIITKHSKPWISKEVSSKLKEYAMQGGGVGFGEVRLM